jgi:drug/metabolite transporter (DMT)-like permease
VAGYFGYHFFLFYSFRFAPAVEANLINYLWPMLMVLLTPVFFRGQKLHWYHVLGGVMALTGSVLMVSRPLDEISVEGMKGYWLALGAAITWPVYSLGRKKLKATSVWSIGGSCLGAGLLCLLTHALIEPRVVLQMSDAWIILLMGIGPFGIAFYAWDRALYLGNPKVIGALAYLTPVISTMGLVLIGGEVLKTSSLWAMILIIGGASLGLLDFLPSKKSG